MIGRKLVASWLKDTGVQSGLSSAPLLPAQHRLAPASAADSCRIWGLDFRYGHTHRLGSGWEVGEACGRLTACGPRTNLPREPVQFRSGQSHTEGACRDWAWV